MYLLPSSRRMIHLLRTFRQSQLFRSSAHGRRFSLSTTQHVISLNLELKHDNILTQIERDILQHENLDGQSLVKLTKKFHTHVYDSMIAYPWFQSGNHDVAYIQLLLNNSLEVLNSQYSQVPCYVELYRKAMAALPGLKAGEAANIAVCFMALGLPLDDPMVRDTLRICENRMHETTINELSAIATFLRMMGRNGLQLGCKVTARVGTVIDDTPACCDLLEPLLNTYNSIQLLAADDLGEKFQEKFMSILHPNVCLLRDPKTMGAVLRGIRRFPLNKSEEHYHFRNSISVLVLQTLRNETDFGEFNHSHIGELCNHLQNCRLYHRDLAERFQDRAMEIILNTNRIVEISNSLFAFHNKWVSRDCRRGVENQIYKHMADVDILVLSNMADTLRNMNCRNSDVLNKFHHLILENADSLFLYITRLEKVVRHLSWHNFRSRELEDQFMAILLNKLSNTQLGLATWCLTTVACYLLRNTKYSIEPVLYDKLLRIIPQCKVRDLYPILVAMNTVQGSMAPSAANQLYRLQTMIYEHVAQRMDTIDSLDLLSQIITELLSKSPHPDTNIIERLMTLYPRFTKRLTKPQYHRVIIVHSQLKFFSPRVFEDLTDHMLERGASDNVTFQDLTKLMTLFNAVGYTPPKSGALRDLLLNFYDAHSVEMDVDEVVTYVHLLAGMQIFPEDIISDVFNMDFIQRLDKFLAANPEKRHQMEFIMMKLNRMVAIECPELDIPWFHDQYCRKNVVSEYNPEALTFSNRVSKSLNLLLGSQQMYRTWVYSPYYYHINFEVLLDESGKVINVNKENKQPKIGQRVAIRCLVESNFCYNDDELNGFEKIKLRHLEMLGYKVVQIPYFEWNSMGLADEQSKTNYLRNKIFN